LKDYIEERALGIANYIIDNNATVRQTAKAFGVSKSTVHVEVTKRNGLEVRLCGWLNRGMYGHSQVEIWECLFVYWLLGIYTYIKNKVRRFD